MSEFIKILSNIEDKIMGNFQNPVNGYQAGIKGVLSKSEDIVRGNFKSSSNDGMFSQMMAGLRAEAELVSASNASMLAECRGMGRKDRTMVVGAGLGMGGIVGLMSIAMSNVAAASLGAGVTVGAFTTAMAAAAPVVAGLGSVAVAGALLPVATVAVLGAAVAGVAIMGISQFMSNERDVAIDSGNQKPSISDWIKGARNVIVKTLGGNSMSWVDTKPVETNQTASLYYEMEDLFSNSAEEMVEGQRKIVEKISVDNWEKHGMVVSDDKIHECLGRTRGDSTNVGKVLGIDLKSGLVTQSIGRGQATVHNLADFAKIPVVGQMETVSYRGGKIQGILGQVNVRDASKTVGR